MVWFPQNECIYNTFILGKNMFPECPKNVSYDTVYLLISRAVYNAAGDD